MTALMEITTGVVDERIARTITCSKARLVARRCERAV